jgi:ADP-heptose:LPS heptosyltransferase
VGLAWRTISKHENASARSLPAELLMKFRAVGQVTWFSLHHDPETQGRERELLSDGIVQLETEDTTIEDTAAIISELDLIVSVDTMVAHLAGALARPVWTLLPFAADWRWLRDRADSPWYPTMRLFRQPARGDWSSVITTLTEALCAEHSCRSCLV